MKTIWLRIDNYNAALVTSALEAGIDTFYCTPEIAAQIRQLARVRIAGPEGDLQLGKDFFEIDIHTKKDEENAAQWGKTAPVLIRTQNWEIIPIENLIASNAHIIWEVPDFAKAALAFSIMEKGVQGVLLNTTDAAEVRKTAGLINDSGDKFNLNVCEIVSVEAAGLGDRVCVDTATLMTPNQGMLAGNSSAAMLLVQSEASENPYVAARPFRVNLSAVHAYTLRPDNRTSYLSELKSGDKIIIVNKDGKNEIAIVGRIKREKRPLLQVTFRPYDPKSIEDKKNSPTYTLLLQNAETVRLLSPEGIAKSVAHLKPGDLVLGKFDKPGRHFGMAIEETIEEK